MKQERPALGGERVALRQPAGHYPVGALATVVDYGDHFQSDLIWVVFDETPSFTHFLVRESFVPAGGHARGEAFVPAWSLRRGDTFYGWGAKGRIWRIDAHYPAPGFPDLDFFDLVAESGEKRGRSPRMLARKHGGVWLARRALVD